MHESEGVKILSTAKKVKQRCRCSFVDKVCFLFKFKIFRKYDPNLPCQEDPFRHHSVFFKLTLSKCSEHINDNDWAQDVLYNNEKNHLLLSVVMQMGEELEAESVKIKLIYRVKTLKCKNI